MTDLPPRKLPTSDGERLVAAYLTQRRFSWEHEPTIGGRNIDFVAETESGPVALEVYEPRLKLWNRVGAYDPIGPIEGAFSQRKLKQIRAVKDAGLPLILVVGSANSDIPYDILSLAGAMFGRPGFRMAIHEGRAVSEAESAFFGPGKVQPGVNRGVSALALIRRFNPTLWRLRSAWRSCGLIGRSGSRSTRDIGEATKRMFDIESSLTERGVYLPDAWLARLVLAHNPFSLEPIAPTFAGPHDDEYGLVSESSTWGRISTGRLRHEVGDY